MSVLNTLARLANSTLDRIGMQMEMVKQAKTDPLTGLYNRKEFNEQLTLAIHNSSAKYRISVLFLDLDLFKNINDTMRHSAGDQVLLEVADRIQISLTDNDTLARIGGDEFIIFSINNAFNNSAESLANNLIEKIGKPFMVSSHELNIGVSIGICNYPEHALTAEEMIKNADIAMYKAKSIGKNQYYLFNRAISDEIAYLTVLKNELVDALSNDQLSLVYQPQFNINTMKMDCVEVLLRWHHDELGMIPPDVFIPLPENSNMIAVVTDWVLKHAILDMVQWQKDYPDIKLAINISAVEFSPQLELMTRLTNAIQSANVNASDLEIELTETAFLKHPEHASKLARQLSDEGFSIALDDFGTGYASLTYLIQLPIDRIKIDRSFVDNLEGNLKKQSVINGMFAIAKGLNIPCLGEGVETNEQLSWLKKAGCTDAQGYLLSKLLSLDQLMDVFECAEQANN